MPAVKCDTLAQSYDLSDSTWTTTDKLSSSSYCYKMGGNEETHITIIGTGGGKSDFQKFHIRTLVENFEVKINYFYKTHKDWLIYDGLNNSNFPSQTIQAVNQVLGNLKDADNPWHAIAIAFCNEIGATVKGDIEIKGPAGV